VGLAFLALERMVTLESCIRFGLLLPAMVVGVALGARGFVNTDPASFRRWVLRLIMLLAVLGILHASYELAGPVGR
jgi:hypothetical protein